MGNGWGGKREGAGRKAEDGATDLETVTVYLPRDVVDEALALGDGNLSLGFRRLIKALRAPAPADQEATRGALWRRK